MHSCPLTSTATQPTCTEQGAEPNDTPTPKALSLQALEHSKTHSVTRGAEIRTSIEAVIRQHGGFAEDGNGKL